jgi:hypothetical protein
VALPFKKLTSRTTKKQTVKKKTPIPNYLPLLTQKTTKNKKPTKIKFLIKIKI